MKTIVARWIALLTLSALPLGAQTGSLAVKTVAGLPNFGTTDGLNPVAKFYSPSGVAVDAVGNVYVADANNDTIRMINPAGLVVTLAGSAQQPGAVDGADTNARFRLPYGVAVDAAGNVYVADTYNQIIRKITTAGTVTTIAGVPGVAAFRDGPATTNASLGAEFNYPFGIAVDGASNIYVADSVNNRIRKITGELVITLAGNGGLGGDDAIGTNASFNTPYGIACDASGNLFVADYGNNFIRLVSPIGAVSTIAGRSGTVFSFPTGLAVDGQSNIYVADRHNQLIRKLSPAGTNWVVGTLAGQTNIAGDADGAFPSAQFSNPFGVAVDAVGNVYVGDSGNGTVREVSSGGVVTTLAGPDRSYALIDGVGTAARLNEPYGVAVDAQSNIYVADTANNAIREISTNGQVITLAGLPNGAVGSNDGAGSAAGFHFPTGIAVDADTNLYVADFLNSTVRKLSRQGTNWQVTTIAGQPAFAGLTNGNGTNSVLNHPYGIAVDAATNLYVSDAYNNAIRLIATNGDVSTYVDSSAGLSVPLGIAVDAGTNLYVVDSGHQSVRQVAPGGTLSTLSSGLLTYPQGVAVDASGQVYVSDTNNTIVKIDPVTTNSVQLAGVSHFVGSADGVGTNAQFDWPIGLAVDASSNVYIADKNNNTIRLGVPQTGDSATLTVESYPPGLPVTVNGVIYSNTPETVIPSTIGATFTNTAAAMVGYVFTNWTLNGIAVSTEETYVTTLTSNVTLVANYLVTNAVGTYTLSTGVFPAGAGTVTGSGIYAQGSMQNLTVTPASGYYFIGWAGDGTGTNTTLPVTLNTNLDITAYFAPTGTNIQLIVLTRGNGRVTPNLNGRSLKFNGHYALKATPAAGSVFSNWTGTITTNRNPLSLKVEASMVLQANFISNPFVPVKGKYNGLFMTTNGVTEQTSGMLRNLNVNQNGVYSAALALNGVARGISGKFTLGGQATNHVNRASAQGGPFTVELNLVHSNGMAPAISGTVIGTNNGANWSATLVADIATNAVPSAEFTMLIPPGTNNPPALSPGGDGYILITNFAGTVKNPAAAHVRLTGALADGTPFAQTVFASQAGFVPVYGNLYGGKGLVLGWINLNTTNTDENSLTWIHEARPTGLYRGGFTNTFLTNQIPISRWTNSLFQSLTNITLLDSQNGSNVLFSTAVSVSPSGKITGNEATGSVNKNTGLVRVTAGTGSSRINAVGALVPGATNGGGYFLTKTNAQALKIGFIP